MIDDKLRDKVYSFYKEKTYDNFSPEHQRMMVVTRLGQAVEAWRCGSTADIEQFSNLIATAQEQTVSTEAWFAYWFPEWYEKYIIGSVEDRLADAAIRTLIYAGQTNETIKPKATRTKDETSLVEVADRIVTITRGKEWENEVLSEMDRLIRRLGHKGNAQSTLEYLIRTKLKYYSYRGLDNYKRY